MYLYVCAFVVCVCISMCLCVHMSCVCVCVCTHSSDEVVTLIHGLSRDGTTVVTTIHSPTAQSFSLFDRVLILAQGHTVYFGALGA